jgi:putative transposase
VLDGIVYRMRSGCQWNQLPRRFGADSTVHGWFQRFVSDGVLEETWAAIAAECEALGESRLELAGGRRDDGQGPHGRRQERPESHR